MNRHGYKGILLTAFITLLLVVSPIGGIATAVAASPEPYLAPEAALAGESASVSQQQALSLINADRAAHGLPPLQLNTQLSKVAENYAQDMINREFFAHINPEGKSPADRMRQQGVRFMYAGENLAINNNIVDAQKAFMNSPGHRANILNPKYAQVGIGVKYSRNKTYVVQEFIDS